mmetsp:Transcript_28570/g.57737  ORF Transcript_28570/g.57737 Transcript_28570/m.57737 type:complete len:664 (+) Transcript_28570:173-2164(+)
MSRSTNKSFVKKSNKSPIRVILRCAWDGSRLAVPPTDAEGGDAPIRGTTTLFDLVSRLKTSLPGPLFRDEGVPSATLVCLRKVVARGDWETTTLKQILDGDDGSAGVILTLDLGEPLEKGDGRKGGNPVTSAIKSAASKLNMKPVIISGNCSAAAAASASVAVSSGPESVDISNMNDGTIQNLAPDPPTPETTTTTTTTTTKITQTPDQAWSQILQKNFDATTKDCLTTLLKIIDNLLSRPNDPKVRSIRCANAAFENKVGRCHGAYDFLYSMGFVPKFPAILGGMGESSATPEMLELTPENESREILFNARKVLVRSATMDLGMDAEDVPPMPKDPPVVALAPPSAASLSSTSEGFNIYRTHSHNVQSAAVGAPDPYNNASSVSLTERQLKQLQSKKDKLEREMQVKIELDRGLAAYRPGNSGPTVEMVVSSSGGSGAVEGKGDSSLVASRLKRMEEERRKREEGGFTTKAMRDLEKMKKAKVYSHAQIRINFSDGTLLHAKFLPSETVSSIRSVIQSSFHPSIISQPPDFDLYIAPPRRVLDDKKTLEEEELVPAAKIHVSWKVRGSPNNGNFLREELFAAGSGANFPEAKPIVEKRASSYGSGGKASGKNDNNTVDGSSKEELLIQRMMGKNGSFFGGKTAKKQKDDSSGKKDGKPKWFK